MSEPTEPTPEQQKAIEDRIARGKRITELLKIIEESGDELMHIEFEDKTLGVERFKRIQNLAEEIQQIHKLMARRVADFARTDYAMRVCTTRDLDMQTGEHDPMEAPLLPPLLGRPALMPALGAFRGGLGEEPNDLVSMFRSVIMTQQRQGDEQRRQGDEREARESREAKSREVRELSESLAAAPEGSRYQIRIQVLLDKALKALEESDADHGADPAAPGLLPVVRPELSRGHSSLGAGGGQDERQLREADGNREDGAQGAG